jgi:uncharacterized membrane protein YukC
MATIPKERSKASVFKHLRLQLNIILVLIAAFVGYLLYIWWF